MSYFPVFFNLLNPKDIVNKKTGPNIKNQHPETINLITIPHKTYNAKVNLAIQYIWSSYWMILDEVEASQLVGVTPQHLSRLFKETTGMSFLKYCTALRLNRAAWLLLHTEEEIRAIAHKCGYESTSYFIRRFREATEKTPMQFRTEALKEKI